MRYRLKECKEEAVVSFSLEINYKKRYEGPKLLPPPQHKFSGYMPAAVEISSPSENLVTSKIYLKRLN